MRRAATVIDQIDATARALIDLPDDHGTVRLGWFASGGSQGSVPVASVWVPGVRSWPKRSALDAVEACRCRCWRYDWVIDLDIEKFFDTVP